MSECARFLRSRARELAAGAAASVDLDEFAAPLSEIIVHLSECLGKETLVSLRALEGYEADAGLTRRLLVALEKECIEAFRKAVSPETFPESILALRQCIRKVMPRLTIPREDVQFYLSLLEAPRQLAQGDQRRALSFLQGIMATIREMVYVHDTNGNLLFINDCGLELSKYTREDLLDGMTIQDFVVPEYADLIEARLESPGAIRRSPYCIEIYAKDGERIPVEITTHTMMDSDEVVAVTGIARDLRLERMLARQIQRVNRQLDSLVSNAPIGIVFAGPAGVIQVANPAAAKLCGAASPDDLTGQAAWAVFSEEDAGFRQVLQEAAEERVQVRKRCATRTRFGVTLNCEAIVAPLLGDLGRIEAYLILLVDVSDNPAAQGALIQSEKLLALGEIMAGVAHELNNPLTGILGYAQFLLGSQVSPPARERLEHIVEEAERCRTIVQGLLAFSQRHPASKSLNDINAIVRDTLALREYQLRVDDIHVSSDLDAALPEARVDPHEIQRMLLNLITNAQQALIRTQGRERRLCIRTYEENAAICLVVEDNGPGIPAANKARVFDPFFTTKGVGEGVGLGLSVVYGVVQRHNGRITVESEEGQGAKFTICLPT